MSKVLFDLKRCPYCKTELIKSFVNYHNKLKIQCLECIECNSYLFSKSNYKYLQELAAKENRRLNSHVHYYTLPEFAWDDSNAKRLIINEDNKSNKISKINKKPKPKNKIEKSVKQKYNNENSNNPQYVKSIVLSYNRKCFNEKHTIIDIIAIIKVATHSGIIEVKKPAAYCPECSQYIILKSDFKSIKKKGALLCEVIDKTPKALENHNNQSYLGTESKIHALGYNVIKEYGYTYKQRKIILANIMENYNISKHEILSMLDTNIARKIKLPNYADAVSKWKEDRIFVENYKRGDIPEVLIDKVTIGKR